ncbi:DUF2059 domain-containing protein [Mesonia aquimarina]|uniref:DUF2059 domain-containing protein n=1 Tax=Mesonia aquimarina TaxID=1504967 RepID=UPI000EF57925|nr:DUF2059 domain-containing protein [Mesonia aquimarina]
MKKIIFSLAFISIGFAGMAQEEYKEETLEVIKIQSGGQFEALIDQFKAGIPDRNKEAFVSEVKAELPALYEQLADIYMQVYSKEDIDKIMDFYNSPIGQKIQKQTPKLLEKSTLIGQQWGMQKLQPIITKYRQQ